MSKQKQKLKTKHKVESKSKNFFEKADQFFDKRGNIFFWISLFFTLLFSFLLFNFRVSEAGDDSAYILRAFELVKEFKFPSFQGPLYPMVMSIFIWIFGLNVTLLKALSLVFIIFHLYFFYKAFKENIPGTILIFVMIILSFNSHLLYYSSQTFNEAFFMFIQSILIFYFFKVINKEYVTLWKYILLGLLVFLMGMTKTIGFSALLAVMSFLAFDKKWKALFLTLTSFIVFYFILGLIKEYVFDLSGPQFKSQLNTLLQKDPYDASKGMESFSGFIQRFLTNSNLYLSKHLFNFLGLKSNQLTHSTFLTILVYVLFFVSLSFSFKRNKYLFFVGLYLLFICGATFVSLQTRWDQSRLIIPFLPLILVFLISGLYYLRKKKNFGIIGFILPVLFIIMFFTNLNYTSKKVKQNNDYLMNALSGNDLYGLTPDWVNYVKMSKWAGENVPESVEIACRKPSVSFIYAERKFEGIYRIPSKDPDTLIANLKQKNIHYVIMGSLRKYPTQKTEYTINTVQRYLYYIQLKYPQSIILVNKIGMDESAYLFKIDYDKAM